MKFSLNRDDLIQPLHSVIGVVEKRQTLPILSYLLVNINGDKITLTATDLEVEITTTFTVDGISLQGDFTVPAKKIFDICKNLNSGELINFNIQENKVIIKTETSRFLLSNLPANNFPNLDPVQITTEFSIPQSDFKSLIEMTQIAIATQDVRQYLNGLLFEVFNDELRAVSTDGHRLAYSVVTSISNPINISKDTIQQIIVPRKALMELFRLLKDHDAPVRIYLSTSLIKVKFDDVVFSSKIIDGRFPDYQRVIPDDNLCTKSFIVDREVFVQSLSVISVLSNERFKAVRLELSNNNIKAVVHNPEQEEAEENIHIEYNGEEFVIGFNINYLLDVLHTIKQDQIIMRLTDTNHSCLISGYNDDNSKYVVMPMRL